MTGFLKFCWIASFVTAALVYPAALILEATATEAILITPSSPEMVEVNRSLETLDKTAADFERKVAQIYGTPAQEKNRFVFVPADRFIHPVELPSLALLPVDKSKNENPLQVQTVYFFAKWINIGAAAAGFLLLVMWLFKRSGRKPAPAPAPPPHAEKA